MNMSAYLSGTDDWVEASDDSRSVDLDDEMVGRTCSILCYIAWFADINSAVGSGEGMAAVVAIGVLFPSCGPYDERYCDDEEDNCDDGDEQPGSATGAVGVELPFLLGWDHSLLVGLMVVGCISMRPRRKRRGELIRLRVDERWILWWRQSRNGRKVTFLDRGEWWNRLSDRCRSSYRSWRKGRSQSGDSRRLKVGD